MHNRLIVLGVTVVTLVLAQYSPGAGMGAGPAEDGLATAAISFTGTVVETTNASRYTYVRIDTGKEKIWAAGPAVAVKLGDGVSIGAGLPNKNFYSPTLKRKFDVLYFVGAILPAGSACPVGGTETSALPPGHPALQPMGGKTPTNTAFEAVQKADGGKTVAEIWAGKSSLAGKQVVVRARVVRFIPNILGMNWLHLRDGTGSEGRNELTVTTKAVATVGQVVTASGVLSADKDFGAGYKYDVIMENATVTAR